MSDSDDHGPNAPLTVEDAVALIGERALRSGLRVAVAESLTSGQIASRIGAGKRASEWFAGGVVAYQMRTKEDVLDVPPGVDPCSAECAVLLAEGVHRLLSADVAIAATGVGGPEPEDGHEPGTVYLGWSTGEATGHRLLQLDGGPEEVLEKTVSAAVGMLAEIVPTVAEPAAARADGGG